MFRNNFYLHFATDLKRAVFCLTSNNDDGATIFIQHAKLIYNSHLTTETVLEVLKDDFVSAWETIMKQELPSNPVEKQKYAEDILRLSSLVFYRTTAHLQQMDGPLSAQASSLETPPIPVPGGFAETAIAKPKS